MCRKICHLILTQILRIFNWNERIVSLLEKLWIFHLKLPVEPGPNHVRSSFLMFSVLLVHPF